MGEPHETIADDLRSGILRREHRPGDLLPKEEVLAEQFGVSRAIVRRALRLLRQEGLIESRRGRGTYVRPGQTVALRYRPDMTRGGPWTTSIATVGRSGAMRPLGTEVVRAGRREASWLELSPGAEVIVRHRHILDTATGEPIQLYDSYLPLDLVRDTPLAGPEVVQGGVYRGLERIGHRPAEMGEEISARMPTSAERATLRLGERTPVLEVVRVTRDEGGLPVEALHIVAAADRGVLVYDRLPIAPNSY